MLFTQILVPGTTTTAMLQQLLPDTPYNVGVVALYSDGEGPALNKPGKTRKMIEHRQDHFITPSYLPSYNTSEA